MSISGIGSNITGTTGTTGSPNPMAALSQNYETFLQLLTAQLKNQDPLQPQETSEFTNQLVQFSQVEQQIATNSKLDNLTGVVQQGQATVALQYIGKTVELEPSGVPLLPGGTTVSYDVDGEIRSATLVISDKDGNIVNTQSVPVRPGRNAAFWDGKDATGKSMSPGFYTAAIKFNGSEDSRVLLTSRYVPYSGEAVPVLYDTGKTVTDAKLVVRNMAGETIYEQAVSGASGAQRVTWDGKDKKGKAVASGYYDIAVESREADPGTIRTSVMNRISGVDMSSGETNVLVGSLPVPMSNVRAIYDGS